MDNDAVFMGYDARISGLERKYPPLLRQREIRFGKKLYICSPHTGAGGEMVDALVSGASVNCDV